MQCAVHRDAPIAEPEVVPGMRVAIYFALKREVSKVHPITGHEGPEGE
jgi:hypothetical protein